MVKRSIEPKKGTYDFPGGFMEISDDSMESTTLREAHEEIGLTEDQLGELHYVGSGLQPYNWEDSEIIVAGFFYWTELLVDDSLITVDSTENELYEWVPLNEVLGKDLAWDLDRRMFPNVIESYNKHLGDIA